MYLTPITKKGEIQDEFDLRNNKHLENQEREYITKTCPREKTQMNSLCYTSRLNSSRQSKLQTLSPAFQKFHQKRRENQLNSLFRIRKENLQKITRYNKDFYGRLNSQQSKYSIKALSKQNPEGFSRQQQDPILSFRTMDLKQSRSTLGPITNFHSRMTFSADKFRDSEPESLQRMGKNILNVIKYSQSPIETKLLTPKKKLNESTKLNPQTPAQKQNIARSRQSLSKLSIHHSHLNQISNKKGINLALNSKLPEIYTLF